MRFEFHSRKSRRVMIEHFIKFFNDFQLVFFFFAILFKFNVRVKREDTGESNERKDENEDLIRTSSDRYWASLRVSRLCLCFFHTAEKRREWESQRENVLRKREMFSRHKSDSVAGATPAKQKQRKSHRRRESWAHATRFWRGKTYSSTWSEWLSWQQCLHFECPREMRRQPATMEKFLRAESKLNVEVSSAGRMTKALGSLSCCFNWVSLVSWLNPIYELQFLMRIFFASFSMHEILICANDNKMFAPELFTSNCWQKC